MMIIIIIIIINSESNPIHVITITGQDRTRQDPTHTLQQACCCIYSLVTEVKTIIISP